MKTGSPADATSRERREELGSGVPDAFTSSMTPAAENLPQLVIDALESEETPSSQAVRDFQVILGSLLYCATHTRPDVAYAVGMLCRAMSRPTPALYAAALRVLYYLYRHHDLGLRYERSEKSMHGFTDSDWAVRRSTSGHVFMHCSAAISWSSKRQPTVALSSCEAEIMAASEAAKEGLYLRRFLAELGTVDEKPTALATDNTAARDLAYNPEHHSRTKHIERRHFFIRETVDSHELSVPFVRTAENLADFFTKPLAAAMFFPLRDEIMNVRPCTANSRIGGCRTKSCSLPIVQSSTS